MKLRSDAERTFKCKWPNVILLGDFDKDFVEDFPFVNVKILCLIKHTTSFQNFWNGGCITVQNMKFSIKDFFSKCDLTEEILNGKLNFFLHCIELILTNGTK